jgi:hypothetical protein
MEKLIQRGSVVLEANAHEKNLNIAARLATTRMRDSGPSC